MNGMQTGTANGEPAGWPAPALLIAVPLIYSVGALVAMLAAWGGIAALRAAGIVPAGMRLMDLLMGADAASGPHAAAHFALVGAMFTANGLTTGLIAVALARVSLAGGVREGVPLGPVAPVTIGLAAVGMTALHAASFLLVYALAGRGVPAEIGFDPLDWRMMAYPLGIVLVAPVAEEIIFRGWLTAGLAARLRSAFWVTVIVALAWAAVHTGQGFAKALALVPVGLALGWLRLATGSLWPCIAGHMAANAAALAYMTRLAAG